MPNPPSPRSDLEAAVIPLKAFRPHLLVASSLGFALTVALVASAPLPIIVAALGPALLGLVAGALLGCGIGALAKLISRASSDPDYLAALHRQMPQCEHDPRLAEDRMAERFHAHLVAALAEEGVGHVPASPWQETDPKTRGAFSDAFQALLRETNFQLALDRRTEDTQSDIRE